MKIIGYLLLVISGAAILALLACWLLPLSLASANVMLVFLIAIVSGLGGMTLVAESTRPLTR